MRARVVHVIVACLVLATGTAVLANPGLVGQGDDPCRSRAGSAVQTEWETAAAIDGGRVVQADGGPAIDLNVIDPCGAVVTGAGVLRHLAVGIQGTAVVNDLAGADQLITVGDDGIAILDTHGEVTHPTWSEDGELAWAEDLEVVRVASADRSIVTTLLPPKGALGAFSPYFADDAIVAVFQEPSPSTTHEDDGLDNLWHFDLTTQRWSRITDFSSTRDRWSVIRTPIVAPDGTVLFVRITADPSESKEPRFELWQAAGNRVERVRQLPGEMYLAGIQGDRLLWNALSRACNGWALFAEGTDGLTEVGCGRVSTDPLEVDPDTALGDGHDHGGEADHADHADEQVATVRSRDIELAVLIGDFRSLAAARTVRGSLPAEMRGRLVDHSEARDLIRPGVWAIVAPVADGMDPEVALARVRTALRGCRCGAWLAPVLR